jgi:hypothetical protein
VNGPLEICLAFGYERFLKSPTRRMFVQSASLTSRLFVTRLFSQFPGDLSKIQNSEKTQNFMPKLLMSYSAQNPRIAAYFHLQIIEATSISLRNDYGWTAFK